MSRPRGSDSAGEQRRPASRPARGREVSDLECVESAQVILAEVIATAAGAALAAVIGALRRDRASRVGAHPEPRREDMIYIWTEVHGIPLAKAESMWESYERATVVARLGLKGK